MVDWIKNRVMERTSWDGGALIAVDLIVLFLGPLKVGSLCCYSLRNLDHLEKRRLNY